MLFAHTSAVHVAVCGVAWRDGEKVGENLERARRRIVVVI